MTTETEVIEKVEAVTKLEPPKMYQVLLHNDDKTTMDFVISILMTIFHKSLQEAVDVTLKIHNEGKGTAGAPYTKEIAEMKTEEVHAYAKANGFPLVATYEPI